MSTLRWRARVIVLVLVGLGLLVAASAAGAAGQKGALYKISLAGTMSVTVNASSSPSGAGITSAVETASLPFRIADSEIWLPLLTGSPGSTLTTLANAPATIEDNTGPITDNETYQYPDSNGNLLSGSASCTGQGRNVPAARHVAVASGTTGDITLTSDVIGEPAFGTELDVGELECTDSPANSRQQVVGPVDVSPFAFAWNPFDTSGANPLNQKMTLSDEIAAFQVGHDSIGGPATDESSVHSAPVCLSYLLSDCNVQFRLDATYDLTKICSGVITSVDSPGQAAGNCAGAPPGGGGTHPPGGGATGPGVTTAGKPTTSGNAATVPVKCTKTKGERCKGQLTMTTVEKAKGKHGKFALTAANTPTITVVVGRIGYSIAGGSLDRLTVKLNALGRRLRNRQRGLTVTLVARARGGNPATLATVRFPGK